MCDWISVRTPGEWMKVNFFILQRELYSLSLQCAEKLYGILDGGENHTH